MTPNVWKAISVILVVAICVLFTRMTTSQTDRDKGVDADGRHYSTMAGDTLYPPEFSRIAPFCYRVVTPWVASKLPGEGSIEKFKILAFIDAVLMLLLIYGWLRAMKFEHWSSLLGVVLFGGIYWTLKFTFFSAVYIDHMTLVLVLLAFWISAKGWWYLLPPLIFGAFFQKESVIAIVPVLMLYFLHSRGWKWWPLYVLGFFLAAASIIPHFILKNNVHPVNQSSSFYALSESWKIIQETDGYSRIMIVAIFSGLGIMPLVLLSHFSFVLKYLKHNPTWIAMILIGIFLLFGGKDKARLFLYMVPAVTLLTVAVAEDFRRWMPVWSFRAWVVIVVLLHTYLAAWWVPFTDFMNYIDLLVPEHSGSGGAAGFSRVTFITLLFLLANFVLVRPAQARRSHENPS